MKIKNDLVEINGRETNETEIAKMHTRERHMDFTVSMSFHLYAFLTFTKNVENEIQISI